MAEHHKEGREDRVVNVHTADTWTEAVVIRQLLESNGILSPAPGTADPFPLRDPPEGTHGTEVYALESQVEEARRIIESFRRGRHAPPSAEGE
ncbi:MAG TPA: hypothetical protein VMH00_00190 [Candidatus Limnocylindrales bacterium]|nr:hypothetical protein [Candidatus Limnocylindrales bacterium]